LGAVAATDATVSERRLAVSAERSSKDPQAAELAVHMLAQLQDHVTLDLPLDLPQRVVVERLARAYGIADRVSFGRGRGCEPSLEKLLAGEATFAELVEELSGNAATTFAPRGDDTLFKGQRIAIVTNLPTHYRVPLFACIARRLETAGAELRVYFLADVPQMRAWMREGSPDFDHEIVKSIDLNRDRGRRLMPLALARRLEHFRPTIVLATGFSPFVSARLAVFARRRGVPFGVWSGEIPTRRTAQGRVRRAARKYIVNRSAFAVSYGWQSARYLRALRSDLPVVIGRNTTSIGPSHVARTGTEALELLTVGRAEEGKALDVLIAAVSKVADVSWRLSVIGDGPQLSKLMRDAGPRIFFHGAMPPSEVLRAHSKADIFLFPSRYDIFGLVLVEAMGAGTAILVSRSAGSVSDLVVNGVNAVVVEDHDPRSWAAAIERLGRDAELRSTLGENARATIRRRWTIEHAADAMVAGLRLGLLAGERR